MEITVPIEPKGDRAMYLRTAWVNGKSDSLDVEASISGGSIVLTLRREGQKDATYLLRADDLISAVVAADEAASEPE